jgi:thymidine kinase
MSDKVIENGICKYCGRRVYNNNNYTMKNNNEIKIRPGTAISIRTNQKYSAENAGDDNYIKIC